MSTIEAVTMPKWGMTMTEGTITSWLVREGDVIERGQEIVEIETTKLSNVVEAAAEGILRRIVLTEGTTAPVGALAAVIADESASEEEIAAFVAGYADRQGDGLPGQSAGTRQERSRFRAARSTWSKPGPRVAKRSSCFTALGVI